MTQIFLSFISGLPRSTTAAFSLLALYLLLVICVFLILRWFWCWYWKINARLKQLKSIDERLLEISQTLMEIRSSMRSGNPPTTPTTNHPPASSFTVPQEEALNKCNSCGEAQDRDAAFCIHCGAPMNSERV